MAWLQSLSNWLTAPEEDAFTQADLLYLENRKKPDLHPDPVERERIYIGEGSKQRDAEELKKLRGLWDKSVEAPVESSAFPTGPQRWDPMKPHQAPSKAPDPPPHMRVQQGYTPATTNFSAPAHPPTAPAASSEAAELRDHLQRMQLKYSSASETPTLDAALREHQQQHHHHQPAANSAPPIASVAPVGGAGSIRPDLTAVAAGLQLAEGGTAWKGSHLNGQGPSGPVLPPSAMNLPPPGTRPQDTGTLPVERQAVGPYTLDAVKKYAGSTNKEIQGQFVFYDELESEAGDLDPEEPNTWFEDKYQPSQLKALEGGTAREEDYERGPAPHAPAFPPDQSAFMLGSDERKTLAATAGGWSPMQEQEMGGWSKDMLLQLARDYRIQHESLSDQDLYQKVRLHVLKEAGQSDASAAATVRHETALAQSVMSGGVGGEPAGKTAGETRDARRTELRMEIAELVSEKKEENEAEDGEGVRSLAEILNAIHGDGRIGAALSLRVLCDRSPDAREQARICQSIPPLLQMLTSGSPQAKAAAAGALQKITAHNPQNQVECVSLRVVEALVKAAWGDQAGVCPEGRMRSVLTLRNLAHNIECFLPLLNAGVIPPLVRLLDKAAMQSAPGSLGLSPEDMCACLGGLHTLRTLTGHAVVDPGVLSRSAMGAIFKQNQEPSALLQEAGALPMLAGVLRSARDDNVWGATAGLINNICAVRREAREVCVNNHMPGLLAEAFICGTQATREQAAAALWTVYGLAPHPGATPLYQSERTDSPPVCWERGVEALFHGQVFEDAWWDPPVLPLLRMLQDHAEVGQEVAASALARLTVTRPAHITLAGGPASTNALELAVVSKQLGGQTLCLPSSTAPASSSGSSGVPGQQQEKELRGASLEDMRKRRQATDSWGLEAEEELTPHSQVQEQVVRARGLSLLPRLLEHGPATSVQPAVALLVGSLALSCPLAAGEALQAGCLTPLVKMLGSGTPHGKASAAWALCSLGEDPELAAFLVKAGVLPQLVLLVSCGDTSGRLQALRTLLRLTIHLPQQVHSSGAVPALCQELSSQMSGGLPQGPNMQPLLLRKELAVATLLMLCRQSADHQVFVSRAGAVSPLTLLLQPASPPRARRTAASLLDTLAQHPEARQHIARTAIPALVQAAGPPCKGTAESGSETDLRAAAASTLWRLAQDDPPRALQVQRAGALDAVISILKTRDPKAKCAAVLLLGEISFCVEAPAMTALAETVLAMLSGPLGQGPAEACLTVQKAISRGIRASDPRVQIHREGRCPQNNSCDVCLSQALFANAIPALLRIITATEYTTDKKDGSMVGLPQDIQAGVAAAQEAAAGALLVLTEHNYTNTWRAVTGGALLELTELMSRGPTTGCRLEAAGCLHSLCLAGGSVVRLKAPTVGMLVPCLELLEAGMTLDDRFMSVLSDAPSEQSRLQVWREAGVTELVAAYLAGVKLLTCLASEQDNALSITVCRPKALHPVVRLAARGEDTSARQQADAVIQPQKRLVFSPTTPGVNEYTDMACECLSHLALRPQLHFLLHNSGAVSALVIRVQDRVHTSHVARTHALRALLRMAPPETEPGQGEAVLRLTNGLERKARRSPSQMQSILLECGALETAVEALCTAKEEETKVAAAELAANLADVVSNPEQERVVLSMKRPLMILKEEFATCERTRNVVDSSLIIVTGFEEAVASAWSRNQHGQVVVTGAYPTAVVGDIDRLD